MSDEDRVIPENKAKISAPIKDKRDKPFIIIIGGIGCIILLFLTHLSLTRTHHEHHSNPITIDYSNSAEFTYLSQLNLCAIPDKIYHLAGYSFNKIHYGNSTSFTITNKNFTVPQALIDLHVLSGITCTTNFDNNSSNITWNLYHYPIIQEHTDAETYTTISDLINQIPSIIAPKKITLYVNADQNVSTDKYAIGHYSFAFTNIYNHVCIAMLLPNFSLIARDLSGRKCQNLEKLLHLVMTQK